MAETKHTVRVGSGKYTFRLCHLDGPPAIAVAIDRYGQSWHQQSDAAKALASIMAELDAARVVLAKIRELSVPAPDRALDYVRQVMAAMEKHDRLVDDREAPSEWCAP